MIFLSAGRLSLSNIKPIKEDSDDDHCNADSRAQPRMHTDR